jgi:type II secretory pathway pseudopilin PulG
MDKRRRSEGGFISLIGVLVTMACVLIMAAALLPSIFKMQQVTNERGAAQFLSTLNQTELVSATAYQQYFAPQSLTGSLALPISCSNPLLLTGQMAQAPEGYVENFTGSGTPSAPCSGVTGYTSFSVALDPISTLAASRHFLLSSSDGVIHFSEGRPATIADPIFAVSQINLATMQYQPIGTTTPVVPPPPPAQTGVPYTNDVSVSTIGTGIDASQFQWAAPAFVSGGTSIGAAQEDPAYPNIGEEQTNVNQGIGFPETVYTGSAYAVQSVVFVANPAVAANSTLEAALIDVTATSGGAACSPGPGICGVTGTSPGIISATIAPQQTGGSGTPATGQFVLTPGHSYIWRFRMHSPNGSPYVGSGTVTIN